MRAKPLLALSLALVLSSCAFFSSKHEGSSLKPLSEVRYVMGTLLDITLYDDIEKNGSPSASGRAVLDQAFAIAEDLDKQLSTYRPESPISLFNADHSLAPRHVSPEICELIERAQVLNQETAGAFDISVRPLVQLWGRAAKAGKAPTDGDISRVRELIGPKALRVSDKCELSKAHPGVSIETGGIGKGFAVDKIVELLKQRGVRRAFVNFGRSTIAAIGTPPGKPGWPVELELVEGKSEATIQLKDETLSASRAKGNPFVVAGEAYAHIFDPATTRPVKTPRGAAVRSQSATAGEAYVKYLVIRGAPGPQIVKKWKVISWVVGEG